MKEGRQVGSAGSKTRGARSKLVGMGPHQLTYYFMTFSHHLSVVSVNVTKFGNIIKIIGIN